MPTNKKNLLTISLLLSSALLLGGCSGPTEDVRVKTCKQLALTLLDNPGEVQWQDAEEEVHDPEYAVIRVRARGDARISAVCLYAYDDAAEETAETHVDPLSAYETVPYQVTVNERRVETPALYEAMKTLRLDAGRRFIQRAEDWADTMKSRAQDMMK